MDQHPRTALVAQMILNYLMGIVFLSTVFPGIIKLWKLMEADATMIVIVTVPEDALLTNTAKNVMLYPVNSHPSISHQTALYATPVVQLVTVQLPAIVLLVMPVLF